MNKRHYLDCQVANDNSATKSQGGPTRGSTPFKRHQTKVTLPTSSYNELICCRSREDQPHTQPWGYNRPLCNLHPFQLSFSKSHSLFRPDTYTNLSSMKKNEFLTCYLSWGIIKPIKKRKQWARKKESWAQRKVSFKEGEGLRKDSHWASSKL